MKKLLFLLTSLIIFSSSFASFEVRPAAKKATEIFLPVGKNMQISLMNLSIIKVKDFEKLTGKHLNFVDRIGFKVAQKKLRNSINQDGTVDNKQLMKFANETTGFNLGWFAIGFFLGPIGVLIAYIINNENNQNRRKWAWIGFGVAAVLSLIGLLI